MGVGEGNLRTICSAPRSCQSLHLALAAKSPHTGPKAGPPSIGGLMRSYIALLVSLAVACSPERRENQPDAGADSCTGNQTRCLGQTYQTCMGGTFQSTDTCQVSCSPTLGCIECDPSAGNTCNGNDVVTCNPDGSY